MNDDPNVREVEPIQCHAEYYSWCRFRKEASMDKMVWDENTKMWRYHYTLSRGLDQTRRMNDPEKLTEETRN